MKYLSSPSKWLGLLALLMLVSVSAYANKIAYVDARRLLEEAPQGEKTLSSTLEAEFGQRSQALRDKVEQFRADQSDLEKNAVLLPRETADKKARELSEVQRALEREQQEYNQEYTQRRNQSLQQLEKIISDAVVQIAEQNNYDLVVQQAVYASKSIDITDQVLAELVRRDNN